MTIFYPRCAETTTYPPNRKHPKPRIGGFGCYYFLGYFMPSSAWSAPIIS